MDGCGNLVEGDYVAIAVAYYDFTDVKAAAVISSFYGQAHPSVVARTGGLGHTQEFRPKMGRDGRAHILRRYAKSRHLPGVIPDLPLHGLRSRQVHRCHSVDAAESRLDVFLGIPHYLGRCKAGVDGVAHEWPRGLAVDTSHADKRVGGSIRH